ncbi:hypothetical protein [Stenotrophomonas tumulicola]|uniref:Uncharacterized protein n=1 Tax=Stenotrophomonas tumulicola TaxID=1685415 RepID=A0A7W3FK63_9GAMM|nr:hypothetical protein [Stenotrophomonas tumulicola]MBA8680995.1 hypothetical protein [Stenotrophomonas tumulicola]
MFEPFSDQGSILFNDSRLVVRKKGWVNACWTLEQGENIVAVAKKRGIAGRSFDLTWGKDAFLLKQQALIARGYDILLGDAVVGTIEPEHPLTRKAHVECEAAAADIVQLFSFWLVAMVWRSTTDTSPA